MYGPFDGFYVIGNLLWFTEFIDRSEISVEINSKTDLGGKQTVPLPCAGSCHILVHSTNLHKYIVTFIRPRF